MSYLNRKVMPVISLAMNELQRLLLEYSTAVIYQTYRFILSQSVLYFATGYVLGYLHNVWYMPDTLMWFR